MCVYEILPVDVTSAPSLLTFGKRLSSYAKTASVSTIISGTSLTNWCHCV